MTDFVLDIRKVELFRRRVESLGLDAKDHDERIHLLMKSYPQEVDEAYEAYLKGEMWLAFQMIDDLFARYRVGELRSQPKCVVFHQNHVAFGRVDWKGVAPKVSRYKGGKVIGMIFRSTMTLKDIQDEISPLRDSGLIPLSRHGNLYVLQGGRASALPVVGGSDILPQNTHQDFPF